MNHTNLTAGAGAVGPGRWARRAAAVAVGAAGLVLAVPVAAPAQPAVPAPPVAAGETCQLVDFDTATVTPLATTGTSVRRRLTVTGTTPWADGEVSLSPLVYIRQPEYWGIEVTWCRSGDVGLPAERPFTVTYDFTGTLGTQGIEVIGENRRERITLAGAPGSLGLEGTSWVLDPASLPVPVPADRPVTASFSGGLIGGSASCNLYSGPYTIARRGLIRIGAIVTTKIACTPDVAAVESAYLARLAKVTHYRVSARALVLAGPAGALRFRSAKPAAS